MVISQISAAVSSRAGERAHQKISAPKTNLAAYSVNSASNQGYAAESLLSALQGYHGIMPAKTVFFGQGSLAEAFEELNQKMFTCRNLEEGRQGEEVGTNINVSKIIGLFADKLPKEEDAVKTNIEVSAPDKNGIFTEARTQIKKTKDGILYEMAVRQPRQYGTKADKSLPLSRLIRITQDAAASENAYVLNTKGKIMAIAEDGDNILLTNAGEIQKKDTSDGGIHISAETPGNEFHPFTPAPQRVKFRKPSESAGEGTEIVIGMEKGRFIPQIIKSIETFCDKINSGEIVLEKFTPPHNAKKIQLAMLAGGFGSRAEYTNASSDKIFHGGSKGAELTKGAFRTATGLTPMETTFITLHNAGLLDCSKGKIGIGKNIKLYINESGVNKGNGGFTADLYKTMEREGRDALAIFPNDSISRMTEAVKKMTKLMTQGHAAIAMIAKSVKSEDAKGNFGIMKLGKDNEILEFAEKPKEIPDGYEKNGMCLTNTFQFAVSKEAFKALDILEPHFPAGKGKEPRDWSKTYIPVLMALSQNKKADEAAAAIEKVLEMKKGEMPVLMVSIAQNELKGQRIIAVPTDEPWADCGTLNQLYHTTMQIASGDFPLEDFERKHVLDSINTQTGLIASTPEQKAEIEAKYDIQGQVMAVPRVKYVPNSITAEYKNRGLISVNPPQT